MSRPTVIAPSAMDDCSTRVVGSGLRSARWIASEDARVLVIMLLQAAPPLMLLTLGIALYLTVLELRQMEPRPHYTRWIWWRCSRS